MSSPSDADAPEPGTEIPFGNRRTFDGLALTPGVNVDRVNIRAGLIQASLLHYVSSRDHMVITYALQRHARGKEAGAQDTALHHGIDLTSWYAILAAANTEKKAPDA